MKAERLVLASLLVSTLAACSSAGRPPADSASEAAYPAGNTVQAQAPRGQQLRFALASGTYHCEHEQSVDVQRDGADPNLLHLGWDGQQYGLTRQDSTSGLPRFEDRSHGLLWIDLPWKSVLLDTSNGLPLANECKPI